MAHLSLRRAVLYIPATSTHVTLYILTYLMYLILFFTTAEPITTIVDRNMAATVYTHLRLHILNLSRPQITTFPTSRISGRVGTRQNFGHKLA